jgi:hypothetical protein
MERGGDVQLSTVHDSCDWVLDGCVVSNGSLAAELSHPDHDLVLGLRRARRLGCIGIEKHIHHHVCTGIYTLQGLVGR